MLCVSEPHNLCAVTYDCNLLNDIKCDITYIDLPEEMPSWSLVPSNKYPEYLCFEKQLDLKTKLFYSNKWINLRKENAPLRAVVNGTLTSAREGFYDMFILSSIGDEKKFMADVIINVLNTYRLGISDSLVYLRIMTMINQNKLQLISFDSSQPFKSDIKKS